MEQEEAKSNPEMVDFREIMIKAYNRGLKDSNLTLEKLMIELKADLKNMIAG